MLRKLLKQTRSCQRCFSDYPPENPVSRVFRILGNDFKRAAAKLTNKEPNLEHYKYGNTDLENFPTHTDVVVIGGGVMGSSIAYWLKDMSSGVLDVAVIEKDPTYCKSSTVLSVGGIRQQFSLPENIEMSQYGAEFFRTIKKRLDIDIQFTPRGYLLLANENNISILEENFKTQKKYNVKNELLSKEKIKEKFPWLNLEDIVGGCLGLENEGWFDPWSLLAGFKRKAVKLGANYVEGEAVKFEFEENRNVLVPGVEGTFKRARTLYVTTKDGKIRPITFSICIIAAGAQSGKVAEMADIGIGKGLLSIALPVEPRKRCVYCFNSQDRNIPGLNTPMVIDPSGTYFRREGLGSSFIAGRCPLPENEPPIDNLEVDHEFFHTDVWPQLGLRVPAFEGVKVTGSWAGYYDYNTYDENGIIGPHPYHGNMYFATGFSGHGIQQAPAVGMAIAELIILGAYHTIDLTRLGFDRFIMKLPMYETNIY